MNQTMKETTYRGSNEERTIVPNRWQGEAGCVVGPFPSHVLAERFARPAVDFGHYDSKVVRIFVRSERWYVELAQNERVGGAHSRQAAA